MPRKYKKSKRYNRRKYRRYKKLTPSTASGPLAVKLKANMVYSDTMTLNPGLAGAAAGYNFSCNGLYDPNITGIGHQPRGFDQLMLLYDHYVVIASKITITAANSDTGNSNMFAVLVRDSPTLMVDPNDIMENRFVRYSVLSSEGSGDNTKSITLRVNPNKFLGRSKPLADDQLKGNDSANPVEQCYFQVYAYPTPAGTDTTSVYCQVRIEYTAIFIEPKQPAQS